MTAAIYFHPEAYSTSGPKLMGRNAAGESFLRGFLTHATATQWWAQVQRPEHGTAFAHIVRQHGRHEPVKIIDNRALPSLADASVVYYPGPGIGSHALERAAYGHGAWSLCGITHTTSSAVAMDAITALITQPVYPWDAVICTSTAVKDNVNRLLQAQVDYLQDRLGITRLPLPQLPVIPLGIHTTDFEFSPQQRFEARARLGLSERHDALVVLYVGRLSFHAKAHPLAMYQALEAAARRSGRDVVLVECGWHANESIKQAFVAAQQSACPSITCRLLDGRSSADRETAWAAADVFCSLSDNIQETFGIVPIEAMAAGLPVVVSDWDGYKDTVRHGIDGFRIPTTMPAPRLGGDLAMRHALEIDTYDMYCGHTCSLVAVDVQAAAAAFTALFESPEARRRYGMAARQHAREHYDWGVIIPRYEQLWRELGERRQASAAGLKTLPFPWPARMDPFHSFASYPSQTLTADSLLEVVDSEPAVAAARLAQYRGLAMVSFAKTVLPSDDETTAILQNAYRYGGAATAANLLTGIVPARQPYVLRALSWLLKLGILRLRA